MKRETKAILTLSLLSPIFAEVLSGSTPPIEIIANPLSFLFLWAYYGSGVVLFRELWIRKGGKPGGIMLLGFAYGVIEEGIFIKSWFDPNWMDLGILGEYGRIFGTNTVWAAWLTIFHGYMSIWVPVMVFSLIYPDLRDVKLLGRRSTAILLFLFVSVGLLLCFVLNPYVPPFPQYVATIFIAISLIYLATKVDLKEMKHLRRLRSRPFILGLLYSILAFIIFVFIPYTAIPFVIPIILGFPLAVLFFKVQVGEDERFRHSLLLGSLSFWLLFFDFVLSTNGYPLEFPLGLLAYFSLVYLYIKKYHVRIKR